MRSDDCHAAIFLDRDGVLNEVVYHQDIGLLDTPFTIEQFKLLPGAAEAVARINRSGYLSILVSNQPGVAKAHFTLETHLAFDAELKCQLAEHGAFLDDCYYCLDHPDSVLPEYRRASLWRKPEPGMLLAAIDKHHLDPSLCWMIGDSVLDIQAAKGANVRSILIGGLHCYTCHLLDERNIRPDIIAKDLAEAINKLLSP